MDRPNAHADNIRQTADKAIQLVAQLVKCHGRSRIVDHAAEDVLNDLMYV